jgi:hypothetical protein
MGACSLPDALVITPEQYIEMQADNILHGLCVRPGATPCRSPNTSSTPV